MERSESVLRSTMDEHVAVNLSAEQLRDEGIVARSGDPGMVDEDDPWFTGEIEQLERKSLQKELNRRRFQEAVMQIFVFTLFEEDVFRT